jgi:hypothetical protein
VRLVRIRRADVVPSRLAAAAGGLKRSPASTEQLIVNRDYVLLAATGYFKIFEPGMGGRETLEQSGLSGADVRRGLQWRERRTEHSSNDIVVAQRILIVYRVIQIFIAVI